MKNGSNQDNYSYNNVCLKLDGSSTYTLCTSKTYGFSTKSNSWPYEIDFNMPKKSTRTVQLIFRETRPAVGKNYHAQLSDLKIYYD